LAGGLMAALIGASRHPSLRIKALPGIATLAGSSYRVTINT